MTFNFNCKKCNYGTNRQFNYNKHLQTKKHINNCATVKSPKMETNSPNLETNSPKQEVKKSSNINKIHVVCEYCNKSIIYKKNKSRHYKICKVRFKKEQDELIEQLKKEQDEIKREQEKLIEQLKKDNKKKEQTKLIEQLKKENKKKDEELKELKEQEKEFINFMKSVANKNITNIVDNSQTTINNNSINMYHIINNFKEAHNFEDLMNAPLTAIEKEYMINNGSILGCYQLLKSRCIDDVDLEKRPFHCLDGSRSKYLLRTNDDWNVDPKGEKILNASYAKMKDVYLIDKFEDMDEYSSNMKQLLDLEGLGRKKIIKELNKHTLLKNNVKNK